MKHEVIMAGFGGQGVIMMGQLLAYAGMLNNKNISWFPSYGIEMRGGTANCFVVIDDEPVATPIVDKPTAIVAMNGPSLDRFEDELLPGGVLVINSSLITRGSKRDDIKVYKVAANEIAAELGHSKVSNMVVLGAVNAAMGIAVPTEYLMKAFEKKFSSKPKLFEINRKAIEAGVKSIIG